MSGKTSHVAFCITCKGRVQHIEKTLPENLKNNTTQHSKFILLDYASPDHLLDYVRTQHADAIASGKLVVYSLREPGPFQMAHAKNVAHRLGIIEGADILVNLDADNFTGPRCDDYLIDQFSGSDMFMCARMIKSGPDRLARGIAGRIAVMAPTFILAGGYNEKYNTWAPEDLDFNVRLRRMGYKAKEIDRGHLNGIPHHDGLRFREYPHARAYLNGDEDRAVYASADTVVNFGNIGCATVYRNFGETPVILRPLPTRVFGIGMHKTATNSLHTAFGIVGFNSGHWCQGGDQARRVWDEMTTAGRSPTVEQRYAWSDLPIPMLFDKLDTAYPHSKFILTTRDERDWLESVRRHWDPRYNKYRWEWDVFPFPHRIHQALYGRKDFDADVFLARYRNHNADVVKYFASRPADLCVLDMSRPVDWNTLCRFLGVPVPSVPYPTEYKTTELR